MAVEVTGRRVRRKEACPSSIELFCRPADLRPLINGAGRSLYNPVITWYLAPQRGA